MECMNIYFQSLKQKKIINNNNNVKFVSYVDMTILYTDLHDPEKIIQITHIMKHLIRINYGNESKEEKQIEKHGRL